MKTTQTIKSSGSPSGCYACQAKVAGLRDRRPEGGDLECACARHADPTIKVTWVCMYCNEPTRKGSVVVDGQPAHAKCHREACGV